jgi:hypothetical protein
MDIACLHVVINHLPIMGVPLALGLLLLGAWTRDDAIKRAALLGFVVLGALTVPVFLTGKGGEDFVEDAAGVAAGAIDAHEDMATLAFGATGVLAVVSLALFLRHGGVAMLSRRTAARAAPVPSWSVALVVALAAIASAMLGYTGRLGGKISHTEFAADAAVQAGDEDAERDEGREAEERGDEEDGGQRRRRRGRD